MERWRDRVAVVTGASEGIGAAVVRRLAACGMRVVALARRQALLEELERSVNVEGAAGSVKGYICDVTSQSDVTAAFKSIERDLGPVGVLVNNAGVLRPVNFTDADLSDVKDMYDTNVMGVVICVKAGLESMKIHNVSDGHIINISSLAAHKLPDVPAFAAYSSTKHALAIISKGLRDQLRTENSTIRVSCVSPGMVRTAMTEGFMGDASRRHYLIPENVANAVEYVIASPSNVNVTDIILEPV